MTQLVSHSEDEKIGKIRLSRGSTPDRITQYHSIAIV
jgi:hypothetical protein